MNKKILFSAAVLSVLAFGSCVDDTESPSVTQVRQAKAEQIKAIGDYYKAQGEALLLAEQTAAEAQKVEKEYKLAQAELLRAQAAYQQALADYQNAQTESEKQRLAQQIEMDKITLEMRQMELSQKKQQLELLAVQLETQLTNAKAQLLEAQKRYEAALKEGDQKQLADIQNLLQIYKDASRQLLDAQNLLAQDKILLAQLNSNLVNSKEANQRQIKWNENQILNYQSDIAGWQAFLDTWNKYAGNKAEAQDAYNKAIAAQVDFQKALEAASKAKNDAAKAENKIYNTWMNSEYVRNINLVKYNSDDFNSINGFYISLNWDLKNGRPATTYGKWCAQYYDSEAGQTVYIPLFDNAEKENKEIAFVADPTQGNKEFTYSIYTSYYDLIDGGFDSYFKALEASVAEWQQKDYNDAKKAYTEAATELKKAQELADKTAAILKSAKDAVEKAGDKVTQDQLDALEVAQRADEVAQTDLNNAKVAEDRALTIMNGREDDLQEVNDKIAAQKKIVAALKADAKSNADSMKAYNEAEETYANAEVAVRKADYAYVEHQNEVNALSSILNDANNTAQTVEQYQNWIENANQNIAALKKENERLANSATASEEQTIEDLKARIADQEAQIEALKKMADLAKANLDKALQAE